ncbi:SDR family NAD(P)-dependent oxidoreductase [Cupriavidus taiwanensis]|uniref:SDR family NAD(P)-dependent oxidoreductase n=1 Tax=Cupriavidus taiwanensis TaxID=164546 RepID=UPI001F00554A|nr:SDR family NAD(P)-dependent oxidoreductase [Cupriavidus taiwanensis]
MDRRKLILNGVQLGAGVAMAPLLAVATAMAQSPSNPAKASAMTPAQRSTGRKSRIFITGSSDGLGHAAARTLLGGGHEVVVHVRSHARLPAVRELVEQGAIATIGDLSDLKQTRDLARQVNAIGTMDAVIHNAGVLSGPEVLVVNVVAPYLLTALIQRPRRLIYLSSSMHKGGRTSLDGIDWSGRTGLASYSESKLFITTLAAAVARLWPTVYSNAVDPGWVPTKMGGANAPDDLRLGHLTQEWLATSNDPRALTSGGYWYHQRLQQPHPVVHDTRYQDRLLGELARATGTRLV